MNNYIPGCDRSHNNAPASLSALRAKGIQFIFFKAAQGISYQDPAFNASWQEAKAIPGLARGAYHFFDPRYDGIAQAKNYLSRGVNFSGAGCLPPVVDVEDLVGSSAADTAMQNQWVLDNRQMAVKRLQDFLSYVQSATGKVCIIYTYNNYPKEYFHGTKFPNNPMWLSSIQAKCPVRYDTGGMPLFWQNTYNWNGTDMDGDYFIGTQEQLNALANL